MNSTPTPPAAALVADAIARIEERRDVLDRLADKGMEMAERLAAGDAVEIAGRKPFTDPARAFAVVSRAVRLCLALASRLDGAVIAVLRGGPIPDLAILAPETPATSKTPGSVASVSEPAPETSAAVTAPRTRIARAVDGVIEAEAGDREAAERRRAYVHEHLIEGEDYDALLNQPWRVVVQAICADLGLNPDWGAWDNAEGFTEPLERRPFPPPEMQLGENGFSSPAGKGLTRRGGSDEGSRPTFNDRFRLDNPS